MKINRLEIPKIVAAYQTDFVPMIELARRYSVTRGAIYGVLKRAGVCTSSETQAHIRTICDNPSCERPIDVMRSRFRKNKTVFCSQDCYFQFKRDSGRKASLEIITAQSNLNAQKDQQQ